MSKRDLSGPSPLPLRRLAAQAMSAPEKPARLAEKGENAEHLLADLVGSLLSKENAQTVLNLDYGFSYDEDCEAYVLLLKSKSALGPAERGEAGQAIHHFLTVLKNIADGHEHFEIVPEKGALFAQSKSAFFNLLTAYANWRDISRYDMRDAQQLLQIGSLTASSYKADLRVFTRAAKERIEAEKTGGLDVPPIDSLKGALLAASFSRAYAGHDEYLAASFAFLNKVEKEEVEISTLFLLAGEKIKLEEFCDPRCRSHRVQPDYFIN